MDEEALFQQALQEADQELTTRSLRDDPNNPASDRAFLDRLELDKMERQNGPLGDNVAGRTLRSIGMGAAKAAFETKDFLVGEPEEGQKSDIRQSFEAQDRALDNISVGYSLTSGTSQIVAGLIGAGKVLAATKVLQKGKVAFETARGALAGAVAIDPHEERLSDLIESFPDLQNPVTEYLAADPEDSDAEGRFKNALESIGVDFALLGAIKAIKWLKAGDKEKAAAEIAKLGRARAANEAEFGMDFGPTPKETPDAPSNATTDVAPAQQAAPAGGTEAPGLGGSQEAGGVGGGREVVKEQIGTRTPIDPKTGQQVIPSDVKPADVFKVAEVTDDQIDDILRGSKKDSDAIQKFGSRQRAAEEGHKFGTTAKLPWQKLRGTTQVQSFIQQSAKVLVSRFDKAKGGSILSDKRVRDLTNELAAAYGDDPAMILGEITQAGEGAAQMVARMEVSLRIGNQMFTEASDLATKIRNGLLDEFGGNAELAKAELKARTAAAIDVMSSGASILSNSGRSLRRARTQFRIRPQDLAALGSMDPERLAIVMERANGDPRKIALLANREWATRVMNEATWHLTNGLLWMWPTHLVNTTTNAMMLVARPTEKLFGSTALRLLTKDAGRRAELSSVSRQALREYTYTISSLADGWHNAVEAFRRGDSILNPHNTEFFSSEVTGLDAAPLPWKPVNSVWDLAQNAWMSASYRTLAGLPTRTLGGADEFFKTLRYRAVIQSRAALEASDAGLSGQAFQDYMQKALEKAIDPATGRALDANAVREAQTVSFQQDLNYATTIGGSIGRGLTNARKTAPMLSLVLPFVKTPVNVIRYGIKLTPGLNLVQREFRDALRGLSGAEAQAHSVGQMAIGSMFMGLAAHLASTGRFTGAGPDDYKLKQELLATGWKPYSFVWDGEDGKRNYFQMGRFDPAGMAMGMVADIVHLMQKDPDRDYSDLIMAAAIAVTKNLGEKTFLLNLNSAMEAGLDPENRLAKWAGRTAGSMLPFSTLLRQVNPDPYLREARTFIDSARRGLPGSATMPLSMDVFGDPIERYVGVMDSQEGGDVVEAEHNRIMLQTDKGLGKPDPKFEGVDLRDMTLKDGTNAYQRLQELSGHLPNGPSLKEMLKQVIESEAYQDLPDGESGVKGTRLNALAKVVQGYRERAKKVFLRENPELHPLIKQRQREARGAFIENRKARLEGNPAPGARELLKSMGY